jgi:enoyl-CoA hydratase/carnithine racemase
MADVEFSKNGHVAAVRLNRPKSLNAISADMDETLLATWNEINSDPEIWVVVLSAEGERAFCVGADISGGTDRAGRMALGGGLTGVGGPLVTLRKPMIAAVQGYALGGGMELALCADIIIAADTTKFGMPETKVGIIGESGIMHRAIRQLPYRVALAMILTGERLSADDARNFGLVNEVSTFAGLDEAVQRWTDLVLGASPLAVQAAKEAALSRLGFPLEVALATRYEPIENYAFSNDVAEGRHAFQDKRPAEWTAS